MKRFLMLLAFLASAVPCMADINITEGSGKVVASESISSKEYQKIKLIDGTASGTAGAPVDAVSGLSVRLTTTAAVISNYTTNPTTVTQSGTWTVQPGNTPNTTAWIVATSSFGVNGSSIAAAQLGVWTVQPGNTANTTAWKVDGSAVTQPVSGTVTSNAGTGTMNTYVTNVTTSPLQIQNGAGTLTSVGYQASGGSVPVNVLNTVTVTGTVNSAQSGVFTVQPGNTQNTTAWIVQVGTTGVNASTVAVTNAGGVALKVDGSAVTQPVSGTVTANAGTGTMNTYVTNPTTTTITGTVPVSQATAWNVVSTSTYIVNPTTVTTRVLVSSNTTLPTSTADAGQVQAMGDNKGRVVVIQDTPWANVLYATATLTTSTAETVFISSPAATAVNILTRCILSNTSATAATITFRSAGNGNNTNSFTIATPPNTVNSPVGFNSPWPQKTFGANWTIQSSASVSSVNVSCLYYTLTP